MGQSQNDSDNSTYDFDERSYLIGPSDSRVAYWSWAVNETVHSERVIRKKHLF